MNRKNSHQKLLPNRSSIIKEAENDQFSGIHELSQQANSLREGQFSRENFYDTSRVSLGALQRQLQSLKQQQKGFYKLNGQVKMLEKKYKVLENQSKNMNEEEYDEAEQMANLKAEIEGVGSDIRNIEEQSRHIRKQVIESKQQLTEQENVLELLKQQNHSKRQANRQKRQRVEAKEKLIQELKDKCIESEVKIQQLRSEIRGQEKENYLINQEVEFLKQERQQSLRNREKIKQMTEQLKKQISSQRDNQRNIKAKVIRMQEIKANMDEELYFLKEKEESVLSQLDSKQQEYQQVCKNVSNLDMKLKQSKDELQMAEEDVKELTEQYLIETELLQKEQIENQEINQEFDYVSKEATDVWQTITELLKIQDQTKTDSDLRFQAAKVWNEIKAIIEQ